MISLEKTVLCYIEREDKILMLYRNKKENDINAGKWIGVGGHIEDGETPEEAILRETAEETGLTLQKIRFRGIVYFYNADLLSEKSYVYTSDRFIGNLTACDEGELSWITKNDVLSLNLWEGDRIFLDILWNDNHYFELKLYYQQGKLIRSERLK